MAHPVSDSLAGKTQQERYTLKAQACAALPGMKDGSVTRKGRKLTILSGPTRDGNAVSFTVSVTQGAKDETPPTLNPVRITNPPLLVDDPAGDITRGTRKLREDPAAALLEVLAGLL
jgi:hypothetical protein